MTTQAAQFAPIIDDEPRLVRETGLDARVAELIEPVLNSEGFRLVRVRLSGLNGMTLQIMAERADGTMTVEDCETLSRMVSPILDVEDPIDRAYHLEVSSPGIDRPLVRRSDFAKWRGHIAKVETSVMVGGRKRFRGTITDVGKETVALFRDQPAMGEDNRSEIPFSAIAEARLILTDDLIRASLKADKAARAARDIDADQDGFTDDGPDA
ncbi:MULTISPECIES: ribosome maturation factor RimP [unclassified Roseitalea]|uniref:ribosome maturation factor RimP n=1 Tax=unclassified Roseitalea TaxID=2639107 RepID=UPI00273E1F50|nr:MULTISPECIES: ribosome maturation factor RimP [unclassified Roseitalea]